MTKIIHVCDECDTETTGEGGLCAEHPGASVSSIAAEEPSPTTESVTVELCAADDDETDESRVEAAYDAREQELAARYPGRRIVWGGKMWESGGMLFDYAQILDVP